jgi:hypothetical protein
VRVLPRTRERDDTGLRGITFLASASGGRAANAPSYDLALGQLGRSGDCRTGCSITSGDAVAYSSEATNLTPGDRGSAADVYKTSFARTYLKRRGRVTYAPALHTTTLVSATRDRRGGNGPSGRAALNPNGRYVAFATAATDVLPCTRLQAGTVCDTNDLTDIALVDTTARRPLARWASASAATGQPGNGASDIFFWSIQTHSQSLQSRDSDDSISFTASSRQPEPDYSPALGATAPATSAYNNYLVFESANPALDLPLARTTFPGVIGDRAAAEAAAASDPRLRQVYLRYVGRR